VLQQKLNEHFAHNKKSNPSYQLQLRVNGVDQRFESADRLFRRLINPFYGKGSPEDCQVALQLAVLLGRTKIEQVQSYADTYLGLDCNGFVGNYIWHVHQGNAWNTWPAKSDEHKQPFPSASIDGIMSWARKPPGREIKAVSDMSLMMIYVMAEVDAHFHIVGGGPHSLPGHIVLTEPGRFMQHSFIHDTMGFYDLGLAKNDAYGHPAYYAVESTGPAYQVGLKDSWYAIRPLKNAKGHDIPGVFSVFRGSKGQALNFRIAELPFNSRCY
jgi:hypothetical protein